MRYPPNFPGGGPSTGRRIQARRDGFQYAYTGGGHRQQPNYIKVPYARQSAYDPYRNFRDRWRQSGASSRLQDARNAENKKPTNNRNRNTPDPEPNPASTDRGVRIRTSAARDTALRRQTAASGAVGAVSRGRRALRAGLSRASSRSVGGLGAVSRSGINI